MKPGRSHSFSVPFGLGLAVSICAGLLLASATALAAGARSTVAASSSTKAASAPVKLYADPATGQLFIKPGTGRVSVVISQGALVTAVKAGGRELDKRIEQKAKAAARDEVARAAKELTAGQRKLAAEVAEMRPAWRQFGDRWLNKFKFSTVIYGDYRFYTHSGFGPQFLTQISRPGPGNESYNSFDITRAYLNFFFTPTENLTVRLTPNIYRQFGKATADRFSRASAVGATLDGSLGLRLKYAYLQWKIPAGILGVESLGGAKLTVGTQTNPLIDWEEHLYGYRYVNLVPWNFLSLSSTQTGIGISGPVRFGEKKYVDYGVGVYTNTSWTGFEKSPTKQVMARLSYYPFGTKSRFGGLGITGFMDYGWSNAASDVIGASRSKRLTRVAALVHYTADNWAIAGEFDYGKNAFSSGNLFKGAGPSDAFGLPSPGGIFKAFSALASDLQNDGNARQIGYVFFGHARIPKTPFTLFGMFQALLPNTKARLNPFDFQRIVFGIEYKYSEHLRFALDSQNLTYYHDQFIFPASGLSPATAALYPTGISDAVPRDTHAIFLNLEFTY